MNKHKASIRRVGIAKFMRGLVGAAALGICGAANATVLTGVDLITDPNVTLPNGYAATVGNSLQFSGSPAAQIMVNLDLSALGYGLGAGQSSSGSIAVTNTRITNDSDLWYGLWDGSKFAAFTSWDGNRSHNATASTSNGTTFSYGGPGPTINFTVNQLIGQAATATYGFDLLLNTLAFNINGVARTGSLPGGFNTAGSLSFLIGKGSTGEIHQIDTIVIDGVVPEPATLALMGIGLAGLGFSRKKKQANN